MTLAGHDAGAPTRNGPAPHRPVSHPTNPTDKLHHPRKIFLALHNLSVLRTKKKLHQPSSQGRPAVSNPAAESRPNIDPRLGLKFICAHHLIDLFHGGPVDTDLARDMAQ